MLTRWFDGVNRRAADNVRCRGTLEGNRGENPACRFAPGGHVTPQRATRDATVNQLLRYLRAASPAPASADAPDRELLARFARARDASAFAALVSRHGAAVWAACRRLLDRDEDAEDAFQAVFLTLARKAGSVGEDLPAWLHEVARRVAANLRRASRRRAASEDAARVPEGREVDLTWREGLAV